MEIALPQGMDRKGHPYDRLIQYKDNSGTRELVNIVAKLQKDFKRFNQCITLAGAQQYARSKGDNWGAFAADVTGPGDKKDGIDEVFVTDGKGAIRIVNGIGLRKSDYPLKQAYYTEFPTRDSRKATPYAQFKAQATELTGERDEEGRWVRANNIDNIGASYSNYLRDISAKEVFKQLMFQPVYAGESEAYKDGGLTGIYLAQTYNQGLSRAYTVFVLKQVAAQLGISEEHMDHPRNKKRISDAREMQMGIVNDMVDNHRDEVMADIAGVLGDVANEMDEKQGQAVPSSDVPPPSPVRDWGSRSPGRPTWSPEGKWKSKRTPKA